MRQVLQACQALVVEHLACQVQAVLSAHLAEPAREVHLVPQVYLEPAALRASLEQAAPPERVVLLEQAASLGRAVRQVHQAKLELAVRMEPAVHRVHLVKLVLVGSLDPVALQARLV